MITNWEYIKTRTFCQKKFRRKSKFLSKILILPKVMNEWKPYHTIFSKIFGQNCSQFFVKILVKNPNFGQKSKFWSKIQILVKNPNFGQKSEFWSKFQILPKAQKLELIYRYKTLSLLNRIAPFFRKKNSINSAYLF